MSAAVAKSTSSGTKRILQEARELAKDRASAGVGGLAFDAAPLEDNLYEWHFTLRGPSGSVYEGGIYHGRLILPTEYPFRPPSILLLTPSGRFQTHTKICLSITGYHEEAWQPAWGIRTALVGLSAFFLTDPKGAIGSLETGEEERRRLAKASRTWVCENCAKSCIELLPPPPPPPVAHLETEQREELVLRSAPPNEPTQTIPLSPIGNLDVTPSSPLPQLPIHVRPPSPTISHSHSNSHSHSHSSHNNTPQAVPIPRSDSGSTNTSIDAPPPLPLPLAGSGEDTQAAGGVVAERAVGPRRRNGEAPPVWLDRLIVACLTAILALVLKRLA
ncbi:UBC-like protein [Atractiella rhizophila]|nr:UBC-like protein [Atractiella rhizophila]